MAQSISNISQSTDHTFHALCVSVYQKTKNPNILLLNIKNLANDRFFLSNTEAFYANIAIRGLRENINWRYESLITKIEKTIEKKAAEAGKFHDFIEKNKLITKVKEGKRGLYIRPYLSGLARAIFVRANGEVIVCFNRKREGDKRVGKGTYKIVTLARRLQRPQFYASISGDCFTSWHEVSILRHLSDVDGVLRVLDCTDVYSIKRRFFTEYCNGGALLNAINDKKLTMQDKKEIIEKLISTMAEVHARKKYIHRDLKPSNILLKKDKDGKLTPVVGDWGSACAIFDMKNRKSHRTPLYYASCEYLHALFKYGSGSKELAQVTTFKHDSWGLACILYAILTGKIRRSWWVDPEPELVYQRLSTTKFEKPKNKNSYAHLIWEMLEKRITATEAKKRLPDLDKSFEKEPFTETFKY